jgi:hypothetical protein
MTRGHLASRRSAGQRKESGPASEIFRATFLEHLDDGDAQRVVDFGEVLLRAVLEAAPSIPPGEEVESTTRREIRAVVLDLRVTQTLLEAISREREECDLGAADAALSRKAERAAKRLERIARELDEALLPKPPSGAPTVERGA